MYTQSHTGKCAVIDVRVRSCVCLRVPYLMSALRKFSYDFLREARFSVDLHTSTWRVVVVNGELMASGECCGWWRGGGTSVGRSWWWTRGRDTAFHRPCL
jgi:hypothetical protein